ncbi:phosphoenolpyruvate--protein phosphotransferase [Chitinispirillales bacterium ANBcel5]|uniref:phosphoenolpyruvate--protein phosphotransferase n=1 Tax=Cellulosispirillum alkaliphilum TaxID=3039283 RepID=UPI002A4F03F4|nr:phosphoenolpyruvate--protein phosphotransferase [Chitinispirillales bacterium ANBcel5]
MRSRTSERLLYGTSISPGLAEGRAFIYTDIFLRDHELYTIDTSDIKEEIKRIEMAFREVTEDLKASAERIERELNTHMAAIFRAQIEILNDDVLKREIKNELETELINSEQIIKRVFRKWELRFRQLDDETLSCRADDIIDLGRKLLSALTGIQAHTLEHLPHGSIIVAKRLLPSDTVFLSRKSTRGVVTEFGGPASHTALLTKEIGIPAVGKIKDVISIIRHRELLLLDGSTGHLVINPEDKTRRRFQKRIYERRSYLLDSQKNCLGQCVSKDGHKIEVMANVSCRKDVESAFKNGADAIGLFRIENIYLSRKLPPSTQELMKEIEKTIEPAKDKPVTIRLLDVGGDKKLSYLNHSLGEDSFLGRRGIRFLLEFPELLYTQLNALTELSKDYNVRILVPMVTFSQEIAMIREILDDLMANSSDGKKIPLGAMIETPAAALCIDDFLPYVDFLSIGSNDLTQYTLAVGRENSSITQYFLEDHPSIMKLLRMVVKSAGTMPVSLCGELAGKFDTIPSLLENGLRILSVAPSLIPQVKQVVRES